jgi:hypothetical protein
MVANGVVFVGSMDYSPQGPSFFALDAKTGKILLVVRDSAPAIVGNADYWGTGYAPYGPPFLGNKKFYAFSLD